MDNTMRQYELRERHEGGEKLTDPCVFNNIVIGGSIDSHRRKQRYMGFARSHYRKPD